MVDVEILDTSENYYDSERETIVVDERLRQYPDAFQYILLHELKHHAIYSSSSSFLECFFLNLRHELSTDLELAFSNDESLKELRMYRKEILDSKKKHVSFLVNLSRTCLTFPLYIASRFK